MTFIARLPFNLNIDPSTQVTVYTDIARTIPAVVYTGPAGAARVQPLSSTTGVIGGYLSSAQNTYYTKDNLGATDQITLRPVQSLFPLVLNVKDYGAKGDGVTDDTSAIQAAFDDAAGKWGTVEFPPSTNYWMFSNLKVSAIMTVRGQGMHQTRLMRIAGSTGTAIREKTVAEGNPQGATGLWLRDFFVDGNGTTGNGIDVGNQTPNEQLNFNSGLHNIHVRSFTSGTGIRINQNGAQCGYLWSDLNNVGIETAGGGSAYAGMWAEVNTSYDMVIGGSGDSYFHIQIEEQGANHSATPHIHITGSQNTLYTTYVSITRNHTVPIIVLATGANRNVLYSSFVDGYGYTFPALIHVDTFGYSTPANMYFIDRFAMSDSPNVGSFEYNQQDGTVRSVIANVTDLGALSADPTHLGFYGATRVTKPAITGSRGGNAALASLITQGATLGLWTDSTTA